MRNQSGYVALLSVLIMLVFGTVIAVSVGLNGVNELTLGFANQQSHKSFSLAQTCADQVLLDLDDYIGSTSTLSFDDGSCTITVSSTANYDIEVVSVYKEKYTRQIDIQVSTEPLTIISWELIK